MVAWPQLAAQGLPALERAEGEQAGGDVEGGDDAHAQIELQDQASMAKMVQWSKEERFYDGKGEIGLRLESIIRWARVYKA